MKFGPFCSLRCLPICLGLMLFSASASAQKTLVQSSKPINLDKELEGQVTPDRAVSYYHYSLAKWYEDKGDLPKALSEMQIALKYNPNSPAVHLEIASLLERSGNIREAIDYAQEAARLDPEDPDPHWLLANIYFRTQGRGNAAKEGMEKAVRELETLKELTPEDERIYYVLGGAYFELDDPDKAIQAYEKFQSLSTGGDNGYREIAKYYSRNGEEEKAIEYLKKGLKVQPDSVESLSMLGSLYSKLNRNKEAIPVYKKLLELSGNNVSVSRQLAASLVEAGEYQEAVTILGDLAKAVPTDVISQIILGRAQIGLRKIPEAIGTLRPIIAADSGANNLQRIEAQFYLGVAYEESGKYADAAKVFSNLLDNAGAPSEETKANRLLFQQRLAAIYMKMGDSEKAIALYQEMAKAEPRVNAQLLDAYRISRQFDKGIPLGKQLYEKDPSNIQVAVIYARTLADAGRSKEGAEILNKLLQSNPQDLDIYVNLSQIYLQDKRYADAERTLRRAEDKKLDNEDNERLMYELASVYERQKDFDRAESLFKEILKANPNNAMVLNYMGYMLADRGIRLEEALRYVKEALAIDPHNGAYLDSLGWAFFKLNDLENAEKYLLEADELIKNDPVIDEHLGDLYYKTGNLTKAQEFWMRSASIGTDPDDIQKVRQKLEALRETIRKQTSKK
jgi:tetratricopeptide (TPR) repeat protein